jgi:hypothetical protein
VAGCGYLLDSISTLIAPQIASVTDRFTFFLELGEPIMILWLLIFGARVSKSGATGIALPG